MIELENLSFFYRDFEVIQKSDLTIPTDQFIGVVGPNGGGKTTLLKLILGLLKSTTGSITVFGKSPKTVRSRIGYTPQHAELDPKFPISVLDVVRLGANGKRREGKIKAEKALDLVALLDLKDRLFSQLSSGQRQRVLIARALACDPDLLLLDEPTASLDQQSEKDLYQLLNRLSDQMGILLVTHDLSFVSSQIGNVVCVNREIVLHPTEAVTDQAVVQVYGDDFRVVRHDLRSETCETNG